MQKTQTAMDMLKGSFKLSHKVTLYVPTQDAKGLELMPHRVEGLKRDICGDMARVAGGATVTKGMGSWLGEHGLVQEEVYLVNVYCDNLEEVVKLALDWAKKLKYALSQEAIALEVDGEMYFV